jgi:hypothetical protein
MVGLPEVASNYNKGRQPLCSIFFGDEQDEG